jgi:hypothetical protein
VTAYPDHRRATFEEAFSEDMRRLLSRWSSPEALRADVADFERQRAATPQADGDDGSRLTAE